MAKIVIIGGGLTGLSAAYHLEQRGFFDYALFEKESELGGLCKSVSQDGFTFDFTGHLLHINDDYFKKFIQKTIHTRHLNAINRRSFIHSHNGYTPYPFQINLYGLPSDVIADCIEGFVTRKKNDKPISFHDWVLKHFGSGIAKHFFFPFQKKILQYNLKKISHAWTGRFVPKTSLRKMIEGAIQDTSNEKVGYNSQFYYPQYGGIQSWVHTIINQIQNPLYTDHCVHSVDTKNKIVTFSNGHSEPYDILINTMPLDRFIGILKEKSHTFLAQAKKNLVCNSVINFNLGIARKNLSNKHWIYFPENKFPFYRIGFPHNFSEHMTPQGFSSLYGECAFINKSKKYIENLIEHAITQTKSLFNLREEEIVTKKIIHISHAYVIYTFWREKNLPKLLKRLNEYDIHSLGRYGAWKYSSMQEAILDGKEIAEALTILPARETFYQPTAHLSENKPKEMQ